MSGGKFGSQIIKPRMPINTTGTYLPTYTGGGGYARDAKSELFMLAVSNMVGEDTFHESGVSRDDRFRGLIRLVVAEDPEWVAALVPYLRDTMQLRSASIVMAAEYVAGGGPHGRSVVRRALQRGDEPGELLAYWHVTYGRNVPKPIKRGIADAITGTHDIAWNTDTPRRIRGLYTERASLRHDGNDQAWRFADVIELCHPSPNSDAQNALYCWLLDKRHDHVGEKVPREDLLPVLNADVRLRQLPEPARRGALYGELFKRSGWSWERLAGWLPGGMDAQAWEAAIPHMGYMAVLRNLRNFEEAGISQGAVDMVTAKLIDPVEVKGSRQFPIRFYSAYKELPSFRYSHALELALDATLENVPGLTGSTLILLDLSPSMKMSKISAKSKRLSYEIASLFAAVVAKRATNATLIGYSGNSVDMTYEALGTPVLRFVERADAYMRGDLHGGTYTFSALQRHYSGQDRVVIVTDGQAHDAPNAPSWNRDARVSPSVAQFALSLAKPIYTFNVGGYRPAHLPSGENNRYEFAGGLTDAGFTLLDVLDKRQRSTDWPHLAVG